VSTTKIVNH